MSQPSPSTEATPLGAVLVTGGCGFLGSNIVRGLLKEPTCTSISVLSRNPTINLQKGVSYHACDVSDLSRVQELFNELKPTTVMHVSSPRLEASDKELYQANIVGTKNLLKCATECAATKVFVYTSSDSASAPMKGDIMMTEDNIEMYNEHTPGIVMYQKSKGATDILTLAANSVRLRTVSLRVPGLYGENDSYFIRATLEQLKKGQHKFQVGDNKTIRDYLYIDSCVLAHIIAAKALLEGKEGVAGEGFLISDGEGGMPMYDASRKIWKELGVSTPQSEITVIPLWFIMAMTGITEWVYWFTTFGRKQPEPSRKALRYLKRGVSYDITKARERLGYQPVVGTDEGIRRSVKWAIDNGWKITG